MKLKTNQIFFLSLLLSVPVIIIMSYNMFFTSANKGFMSVFLILLVSIFEVILNFLLVVVIINIFTALGVKKRVNEPQDYINKRLWICIILLLVIFITIDFIKVFVAILSPLSSIIFFSSSMSILFVLCSAVNNIVLFTDSSLYLGKYNKEFTFSNIKLYKQNNNNPNDYITIRFTYLGNDYDGVIGKLTFQKMEQIVTDYQ